MDSGNGVPVTILDTKTAIERKIRDLKSSYERIRKGLEIIHGVSDHLQNEDSEYLGAPSAYRSNYSGGPLQVAAVDYETTTMRSYKRMKTGLNIVQNISDFVSSGETSYHSDKSDTTPAANTTQTKANKEPLPVAIGHQETMQQSNDRLKKGLQIVQDVSEHIAGEEQLLHHGSDGASQPISDEGLLLKSFKRAKKGLEIVYTVSNHVREILQVSEGYSMKNLDHDMLEELEKRKMENYECENPGAGLDHNSCEEGYIYFGCSECYPLVEVEENDEKRDDKHFAEGKTVEGVMVSIICACGKNYQLLFTDDTVSMPVPFSTPQLDCEELVPNFIWARKYNTHTEAGLECYFCKRDIAFHKVGNSIQCYFKV